MNILLVEDDLALAKGLQKALRHESFSVNHVACGREAIDSVASTMPDIVVLDLGLPDMDGLTVLKQLRDNRQVLPILVLTARESVDDKVTALDSGADDYLSKPFEMDELLARLRVLARRLGTSISSEITCGRVTLDTAQHEIHLDDEPMICSRREYMLLKALMENIGRIQTRETLENKLYGWGEEVASNTIEVHISHLRKKLPEGFIQTVRGVGYTIKKRIADINIPGADTTHNNPSR